MQRRDFLGTALGAAAMGAVGQSALAAPASRIKQGLWTINFGQAKLSFDEMCAFAAPLGVKGFDVIPTENWPILKKHGLAPLLARPAGIDFLTGIVHPEVHDQVVTELGKLAEVCKAGGCRNIAANAGMLRGLTYKAAADNAVAVCKRLAPKLEKEGVVLVIENVNDHRADPDLGRQDMAFGHWDWGLEVVQRVGSPSVKILCDLYHLQIMDGDLAFRLKRDMGVIGHIHVAGVPTRKEINGTQEVNWRYIAETIAATPYDGYVCHEWRLSPGRDYKDSIRECLSIMNV